VKKAAKIDDGLLDTSITTNENNSHSQNLAESIFNYSQTRAAMDNSFSKVQLASKQVVATETVPVYTPVGRMMISTGRLIAHGLGPCLPIANTFAILCGAEASDALAAFRVFMWRLRDGGWRRLRIAPPGDRLPTTDELAILGLLASAQDQNSELIEARLRWLAKSQARPCVEAAATVVGMALAINGNFILERS
jgi:hypothetical protein